MSCLISLVVFPLQAQEKRKANYQDDLTPIFRESCFGCHNADKTKGGLNLTNYATMMQGGGSGAAIAPGDPDASYLFQLVTHQSEPHMPLNSPKLPDEKLAIIRRFIEEGALENSGSKAAVKKEHSELKLTGSFNQKPDGPRRCRRGCRWNRCCTRRDLARLPRWPPVPGRRWSRSPVSNKSCSTTPKACNSSACCRFPKASPMF